jgi:hypothetical protein
MHATEWLEEKLDRHVLAGSIAPFGVSYLDDALHGILPNDLVLVGARTGRGKTELATTIAQAASSKSREVAFYALEADRWEIHRRLKYRKLAQLYHVHYAGTSGARPFPRYRDWLVQGFCSEWDAIEKVAEEELARDLSSLRLIYKDGPFTVEKFTGEFETVSKEVDLVIIDHLHYFDFGPNESEGLKKAIHAIRDASIHRGKPVILLAHLRKSDRMSGKTLPDLDDFHGHSDIVKVATTVVLLAPAKHTTIGAYPTYFHIAKARSAADTTPFVGVHGFDFKTNSYSEKYFIERASFVTDPEAIDDPGQIPTWAKRSIGARASMPAPRRAASPYASAGGRDD